MRPQDLFMQISAVLDIETRSGCGNIICVLHANSIANVSFKVLFTRYGLVG